LLAFFVVSLDQAAKYALTKIFSGSLPFDVIQGVFGINLVYNTGGAFSIFKNQQFFFIIISCLSIFLILYLLFEKKPIKYYWLSDIENIRYSGTVKCALSLVLGGAIGNLIDRVLYGHVIDFLDFKIWPVFNFADTAISIGIVILFFKLVFIKRGGN